MSRPRKRQQGAPPARPRAEAAASPPAWLPLPGRPAITSAILNLLTVALLTLAFAPFDAWPLAYVALVPWLLQLLQLVAGLQVSSTAAPKSARGIPDPSRHTRFVTLWTKAA